MNWELIGNLIRLRYRLMWANTRTRNGKIVLFIAGYLLFLGVAIVLSLAGAGTGMVAVRSGTANTLVGGVLSVIFFQGVMCSVMLGFGMGVIFSEIELRRYPLRARERRLTSHAIGVIDPFWMLFLVLDLGIAVGVFYIGPGVFWYGLLAVLLLFVSNYIAARILAILVQRLTSRKFGSVILLGSFICLGLLPSMLQPLFKKNPALVAALVRVWRNTPPAQAGVAMLHPDFSALQAVGMVALWTLALAAVLVRLERRPLKAAAVQSSKVVWEDRIDRAAAIYGPKTGPLVAHWLRFYWRNARFRTIYPLALPLVVFLFTVLTRKPGMGGKFPFAVASFGILGFVGTAQFAVNQFGYTGGGFRRFLLLPTDAAAAFRAGNLMFLSLSGILILPAIILWQVLAPIPSDIYVVLMLLGASFTSLFLVHGLALWTSLYGARRGKFNMTFGNDLSFAGNLVVMGSMLTLLLGPQILAATKSQWVTTAYWYVTPLLALAALIFYVTSVRMTTQRFRTRREYLMVLMEGKGQ